VIEALVAYDWPGNVRQLARVVERALALSPGPTVTLEDLPPDIVAPYAELLGRDPERDQTLRGYTSRYTRLVLDRCNGNKRLACRVLDVSYHTLKKNLRYRPPGGLVPAAAPACSQPVASATTLRRQAS